MIDPIGAAFVGFPLAAAYNPVLGALTAAVTAALWARPGIRRMVTAGYFVLVTGWLLGDGMRVIAAARVVADQRGGLLPEAGLATNALALAVWGLGSLALGYALPAWAGAFVGQRVTWGTGWIAAIAVSLSTSVAIYAIVSALG